MNFETERYQTQDCEGDDDNGDRGKRELGKRSLVAMLVAYFMLYSVRYLFEWFSLCLSFNECLTNV